MEIDLSKVIAYSQDSLKSRSSMRSIMRELYPGHTREMNLLLNVYESGIPRKIKKEGSITDIQYAQYVQEIVDDYGLEQYLVEEALDSWIDVCISPGAAAGIKKNHPESQRANDEAYTKPIMHNFTHSESTSSMTPGDPSEFEIKDLDDGGIEIVKFLGFDRDEMVIPTEIEGKRVIGIGANAFEQCKEIKHLIVPEGIEYLSYSAFKDCQGLLKADLPTTLTELGADVFENTGLEEINLPNEIEVIGPGCFFGCRGLKKVLFPHNLRIIGDSAFSSCRNLPEVILPPMVETIEMQAFSNCDNLSRVVLNRWLKRIDSEAFSGTPLLEFIAMPRSVTKFGSLIFRDEFNYRDRDNIIIGCYPGSRAVEYARTNNLKIKDMSKE